VSNHLAVAGVTATLVQLLDEVVNRDVTGGHVTPGRPDASAGPNAAPKVLVFLYRVEPNAAWRNEDLPSRSADSTTVQRPQAALTLNYLLTFVGDEGTYEPQRMLGTVAGTLHFHPMITRDEIRRVVLASIHQDPNHPLGQLDLADQPELVRLTPLQLSLDELSTLWSSFFHLEYRLSVAYRADVVLLTAPVVPVTPLPVRERRLALSTIRRPVLREVLPVAGPGTTIVSGTPVRLEGSDLLGDEVTVIRFGGAEVRPDSATGARLDATVPVGVRAGAVSVVVEHRRAMGSPPQLRPAGQSNVVPVVVHPRIARVGGAYAVSVDGLAEEPLGVFAGTLKVRVEPTVSTGQEVSALLDPVGGGRAFSFFDDRRDAATDPPETADLGITFSALPAGDYLVRIVVSGAQSPLDVGADGAYAQPQVSVP
jgi:hypothetical protein